MSLAAARDVPVERLRNNRRVEGVDRAATEEPLEVRLHGQPFAVIMRTPGADRELAAGFLLSERVIDGADDLGTIGHCRDGDDGSLAENVVNVTLAETRRDRLDAAMAGRRNVTATSACGLCGRLTIESLKVDRPPLEGGPQLSAAFIAALPDRLRARQQLFDETGGLHAAGLFTADGAAIAAAEDVGRHNAVDKVIGRMVLAERLPLHDAVLAVSGRTSFEILQKAFLAGITVVIAVSAPSTLAIDLAGQAGITLAGFVRGGGFNIYTHGRRIVEP